MAEIIITELIDHYAIFDRDNSIAVTTIRNYRKTCIEDWIKGSDLTWADCRKKYGWTCRKIKLTIRTTK